MKDFYYLLGTDATATPEEIREAFRQLSKRLAASVDSNENYSRNHYRDICEAFEVLGDATRRMRYDAGLKRAGLYPGQVKPQGKVFNSVDVAFTIVLILITLLFGDYVVRSITGSKRAKATPALTALPEQPLPAAKPVKRKVIRSKRPIVSKVTTVAIKKWVPVKDSTKPVPARLTTPLAKPAPPDAKPIKAVAPAYLYAAFLQPANQGAIYMRKDDSYQSGSVTVIPENAKVLILADGDAFYKISYNNATGYVLKRSVHANIIY